MRTKCFMLIVFVAIASCERNENPTQFNCEDGIQNGNETGVDCGGDCVECFECLSDFCLYLTGGVTDSPGSITWRVTHLDNEQLGCEEGCYGDTLYYNNWTLKFHSSGSFSETTNFTSDPDCHLCLYSGRWEFDDPDQVEEIILAYNNGSEQVIPILELREDELVVSKLGKAVTMVPDYLLLSE